MTGQNIMCYFYLLFIMCTNDYVYLVYVVQIKVIAYFYLHFECGQPHHSIIVTDANLKSHMRQQK